MEDYDDYCQAIKEAKLPPKPSGCGRRVNYYDETSFLDFVTNDLDLRDTDQYMADFTKSTDVAQFLAKIRSGIEEKLLKRLEYFGRLSEIGSFFDGSKTRRLNEMDCHYAVVEADTKIQQASSGGFKVYVKGKEIKPREINRKLITAMNEFLSEMTLPADWTHGGYGSPKFSGPRCNGPSVTAMFCHKDEKHISLDVSITFSLTSQLQQRADFPSPLRDSCQYLADSISKIQSELTGKQISGDLHLIGNPVDNTWQVSTAIAEAGFLRILNDKCPVIRALKICKVIASRIQEWCEGHCTWPERAAKAYDNGAPVKRIRLSLPSAEQARESILAKLQSYSEGSPCSKAEIRERINHVNMINAAMTCQHIYLSSPDRNKFGEVLKSDASVNNTAMKHIILKTALQLNGAFSKPSRQLERQLVRAVFEELSSIDSFQTEHGLIPGCTFNKFSFSMFLSHIKENIAIDFAQQCETVLDNIFAQKRYPECRFPESHQHGNLAEYCYRMEAEVTSTSRSKLTTARTGEQIAMVLSALINSSGGVLILHLVTKAGDVHDVSLDACRKDIVRLITEQEMWIPENVFNDAVDSIENEVGKEIYFIINKTTHKVIPNSNAYYLKQGNPEPVVDNNLLMGVIKTCSCSNDTICENHEGVSRKNQLVSILPKTDTLKANQSFPVLEADSESQFYRTYQLNDRSLADVLYTPSVQCEILELVSALANTKGGSIFLGVTNTATPTVEGYSLGEDVMKHTEDSISDIVTGRNPGPVTIWGHPQRESTHYWKTFIHDVVGDGSLRKVIEIRVGNCPGGMFCALPVCLDIRHSGEIYQLDSFVEWKKGFMHGATDLHNHSERDDYAYDKHFKSEGFSAQDMQDRPLDLRMPRARMRQALRSTTTNESASRPEQFCWWLSDDGVVAKSLQFEHCCSQELANSEMNLSTKFSAFPCTEAITERHGNIQYLQDSLKEILQEHQSHNGVAVFMENVSNTTLKIYKTLRDVTPVQHVFDLVILKKDLSPVIVSIFEHGCPRAEAMKYCLTLGKLLKRHCSTSVDLAKGNMKLFFRCQLYFLGTCGKGFDCFQGETCYPKDYLCPSSPTIDSVRYALARILLDCQPYIKDRHGNIIVKHLSSCQAKILLDRTWGRSKVMIVTSKAGSGKTMVALEIARRIKKQHGSDRNVAYFCPRRGLAAFVRWQSEKMNIFETVEELNAQSIAEFSKSTFNKYTDVIIDDAHAISVQSDPKTWQMYDALFSSVANAYIFLDPHMQDYRNCIPEDFVTQLRSLAAKYVAEYDIAVLLLDKILRNSRRICQFIIACWNKDNIDHVDQLSTVRQIPEDGVSFHSIQGREARQDETTTLLFRLSNLKQYRRQDIAIVTANQEDKAWVKEMLEGEYETQDATLYPRQCVVVDCKDNFQDLEFPVILVIVPQSVGTDCSWWVEEMLAYDVHETTRRVESLLPWNPSHRQPDLTELKEKFSQETLEDGIFFHNIQRRETLLSRLSTLEQYRRQDITILTETQEDAAWVKEMLKGQYETQDATQFPVRHIVVDMLENFEGLESPVILFIIPQCWGRGCIGSLKYRLCVVTRAISRLEFLLPWDASQRQQDLAELKRAFSFSPPVDYGSLKVTREHRLQAGYGLLGMCYHSGRLYTVEWQREEDSYIMYILAVYSVSDQDTVTLLDTLDLEEVKRADCHPRVDCQSGRVYLPRYRHGVYVVRYDGSKLVPVTTLRCVGDAYSLAVVSTDTLYVRDWVSKTVCLVDVSQDRVTARLQPPREVRGETPYNIAVLGDTVLVEYNINLVIYRHGVPTPGKLIPRPQGVNSVIGLTTDHHSSFLLCDDSSSVYVLDVSGNHTHTIPIPGDIEPQDCTVVGGQLWVGWLNGDIIVMSSQ